MAHTTRRVTYRGNPAFASMLVQMLEQEGATVEWERPLEQRGMAEMAQEVIVNMVAAGNLVAIKVAVDKFRKHMLTGRQQLSRTKSRATAKWAWLIPRGHDRLAGSN